ncbi:MAG TPA: methyltransferase domain-containing protein [Steroidobacteraceae bacterium]|jgi:SAM-dependent methyltransferase|nr:methyltransferase domain-containing protein [Steroidobacteraceae bacterium]
MQSQETHYQAHLGPIYAWMLGDLEAAFARAAAEIDDLPLPADGGVAVDLGAGLGLHALALAERGFAVVAVDTCELLLEELRRRSGNLPIAAHLADLLGFRAFLSGPAQLIVCMGDTLTHLPSFAAVEALMDCVADALPRGGVFAATFRDYAARSLEGDQRFIPVRADEKRILTCFLDYGEDQVTVYDLLHERQDGRWQQRISRYPKLRLAPERVAAALTARAFKVKRDTGASGMARIAATKA